MAGNSLNVDWTQIQKCSEEGMTDGEIAENYKIEPGAIRVRRFRDAKKGKPWATPKRKTQLAEQLALEQKYKLMNNASVAAPAVEQDAGLHLAGALLQKGERASLLASNIALGKLEKAAASPHSVAGIQNLGDVKTAMTISRMAAGMDKPQAQISLSFGAGWLSPKSIEDVGEEIEVESELVD